MFLQVEACIPEYRNPFIVIHGDADTVTSPEASKYLFDNALSEDKALKMMEGMWHAVLCEPEPGKQLVEQEYMSWIEQRLPANPLAESDSTPNRSSSNDDTPIQSVLV